MKTLTCLRYLSRISPILQVFAHHIPDKLAVSFNSFSSLLSSYKWFLTIGSKYSSVKAYNEEISFFLDFIYLFIRLQIHHLHVYFDMIPLPGIRGAFKNSATISSLYLSYAKLSAQTVCIDHIYINCWSPVYNWSVLEKQLTSTPPPPQTNTRICVCVCVGGGGSG